jgi:hypothetical protein
MSDQWDFRKKIQMLSDVDCSLLTEVMSRPEGIYFDDEYRIYTRIPETFSVPFWNVVSRIGASYVNW